MKKMLLSTFLLSHFVFLGTGQTAGETDLGKIVVTATRIGQHDYKIAGNVTIITKEQIEASNASNVPDLLKETLAVHVFDNSTAKSSVVDIRGFGDTAARNVLILVNDRKINAMDISAPDLIQVPIEAVERIEIIRGAGSVLYGDNAVGGVINIITKQGEGDLSGKIGGTYGSYEAYGEDLEVSGRYKRLSYFIYGQYADDKGYRSNSDLLARDVNTRFQLDVSKNINIDFNAGWHDDKQRLPGGLSDTELTTIGRRGSADEDDFSTTEDQFFDVALDISLWPEDLDLGKFVINIIRRDRDVFDSFNSFGPFNTKRDIKTNGVTGKYIFDRTIFDKEVNFVTGIDYYDSENDILGSGDNVDDITISKEEFGIYGFLEYEILENLFFNGGSRYQKADYAFSQRNVAVDEKRDPTETVSMGGLKYEYAKGSNVHFNFQQTFRFLATDEWYSTANFPGFGITPGLNLDLKQQSGDQFEIGVKHNFNDAVEASLTSYLMDIENEIFFDPATFSNSNYEKTRRIGVEFGSRVDLLSYIDVAGMDKLEYFANYTFQRPQFRGGSSDGKDIPMVPRHQASTGFTTQIFSDWQLSFIGRYVGARYAINDTLNVTAPIKPYFVSDLKMVYKKKNYEVFASINNLFDEKYETLVTKSTVSSNKDHFPAPERNVTFGVDVKF